MDAAPTPSPTAPMRARARGAGQVRNGRQEYKHLPIITSQGGRAPVPVLALAGGGSGAL